MKVNLDQKPDKKPVSKHKPDTKSAASPTDNGNVYKEAMKGYMDKWNAQKGDIFRQNKFWVIVGCILFVIFISVNSNAAKARTQLTVQLKRATAETESLNSAIAEVKADLDEQARINSIKLTKEEEELARNNAVEKGVHVATLQNAYRYLDVAEDYQAFTNNKNSLDICFGDNDKNARTEWYSSISGIPGEWEFASKASFKGNTANVLWLCYSDEDHTLLAYCTAKYNADTKLFTDVEWKMTSYAVANIKSDGDTVSDTEQISSIQDALQSLADDESIDIPDDELDDETIDMNNEVSESRDLFKNAVADGEVDGEEYDDNYNVGLGNTSSEE